MNGNENLPGAPRADLPCASRRINGVEATPTDMGP
ncbi:MAG: hypothetical protein QOG17_1446 [Gammaproteobacteria bacterium]|jgi:hypothetical protein|nr:hypothetical protein [Gammaproteobacteria bacterium]